MVIVDGQRSITSDMQQKTVEADDSFLRGFLRGRSGTVDIATTCNKE